MLEHTFDDYYERLCLRGPLGVSLRLRRLAPRRSLAAARARLVTSIPELDPAGVCSRFHGLRGTANPVSGSG